MTWQWSFSRIWISLWKKREKINPGMGREPAGEEERVTQSQRREETNKNTHYGQNI